MSLFQKSYNRDAFVYFLSDSFLPEDFRTNTQRVDLSFTSNFATEVYKLGECPSLELDIFEIHHTSVNDARVGIAKDAFKTLLRYSYRNRALVAFVPAKGNQWRFSLIQAEIQLDENDSRIRRSYSNPRRFSFLLGENALIKTPTQFLIEKGRVRLRNEGNKSLTPWEDLLHRFSIEALTKDFYDKLFNWYLWAKDKRSGVYFPNNIDTDQDDRDDLEIKIIRLITRMLFVWFIKQKRLIPDSLFDEAFLNTILRDFDSQTKNNGDYYNAILQNLFFATLNQEIDGRKLLVTFKGRTPYYSNKQLYRDTDKSYFTFPKEEREKRIVELFKDIPYLNGGLFECLDKFKLDESGKHLKQVTSYDGFSHNNAKSPNGNYKMKAFVPNMLFFAPEHSEVVTAKEATATQPEETEVIVVMGLLELFKQYNFTVEENTSTDKEVSLNPELLGRVFENLLADYNPETHDSARKSTGSFYTPREIVDFMVDEALIAYLSGECGNDADEMRSLVKDDDTISVTNPKKVIDDIKKIKILDPACGSGAFPMGALLKITNIIERLTPNDDFNRYETKLEIIKNCIYGVDIQAIAMLICKLRFFISLICDCERDDTKPNFGILPLPNLETKFVAANTLLPAKVKQYDHDWTRDEGLMKLQQELLDLRLTIFDKRTHDAKVNNKKADHAMCKEIEAYIKQHAAKPDAERISELQSQIESCEALLPTYAEDNWKVAAGQQLSLFDESKDAVYTSTNKEEREKLISQIRNAKIEIQKENNKAQLPGFEQAVEEVTRWDPYDQNSVSPFFDAEWMFGVGGISSPSKHGFDVVIGNPPYIQLQKDSGSYAKLYENCNYQTFARTGDIYCLFYERGWQLLKEGGHLCYITSNKWMRAGYGEKTREFFAKKTNPMLLIDFAGVKIFESATVDTNILLFAKSQNKHETVCAVTNKQNKDSVKNLSVFVQQQHSICDFAGSDSWVILSEIEQSIKRKIEAVGTPLKDWDIQINYGIKTGYNDAFIISTEKRNEILANCATDEERQRTAELIRPILRGRDIKRYGYEWANLWLIYIPWHFPYQFDDSIQGASESAEFAFKEQYPAVYSHMLRYKEPLSKRNKAETGIRYEWYAMQRWGAKYWEDFCKPKILFQEIVQCSQFLFDEKHNFMCNDTGRIIVGKQIRFILGILNSPLFFYSVKKFYGGGVLGEHGIRMKHTFFGRFPCLKYTKEIEDLAITLSNCYSETLSDELDTLIYKAYNLSTDEIETIKHETIQSQ